MKSCPACQRTFEDTFTFCLVDGSILSAPFNPQGKQSISEDRPVTPSQTEVLPSSELANDSLPPTVKSPLPTTIQASFPLQYSSPIGASKGLQQSAKRRIRPIPGIVLAVGISCLLAFVAYYSVAAILGPSKYLVDQNLVLYYRELDYADSMGRLAFFLTAIIILIVSLFILRSLNKRAERKL